ncbi:MAG: hypothetical protein ABI645_05160 [Pseudomonadota bacterium]
MKRFALAATANLCITEKGRDLKPGEGLFGGRLVGVCSAAPPMSEGSGRNRHV